MISFVAHGTPKGQPRPRAFSRGGHAAVYDPGTAEGWKGCVALAARPHLPVLPFDCPLKVTISFTFARPKSHYRKSGELSPTAPIFHTAKPDADNAAKAVLDCLTEIGMWRDDSQIFDLCVWKGWGDVGRAHITIERNSQ